MFLTSELLPSIHRPFLSRLLETDDTVTSSSFDWRVSCTHHCTILWQTFGFIFYFWDFIHCSSGFYHCNVPLVKCNMKTYFNTKLFQCPLHDIKLEERVQTCVNYRSYRDKTWPLGIVMKIHELLSNNKISILSFFACCPLHSFLE